MWFADKLGPMPGAKGAKGALPKAAPPRSGPLPTARPQAAAPPSRQQAASKPAPAPEPEKKKKKGWF